MKNNSVQKQSNLELESLLEKYLIPVKPRPEFVKRLRSRLLDSTRPKVHFPGDKYVDYGLITLVSLAGSALVLITGIRAVLTVMSALGIIHLVRSQAEEKQVSSPKPAL
jgi:hypothetical protein